MSQRKTTATVLDPSRYIAAISDDTRRADCETLLALMAKVTGLPAVMWGTAIVGFGVRTYELAGGKQGEICAVGFSSRKADIAVYGVTTHPQAAALLDRLGAHTLGKSCLYVRRLAGVDRAVLAKLIALATESAKG